MTEIDDSFQLGDSISETSQSSNSQENIDDKDAMAKAAIRNRRRCVLCMSVIPLFMSLTALVLLISQNSEKEDAVYLNDDVNNNNNNTILNVTEDSKIEVVESRPFKPTLQRPLIPQIDVEYVATEALFNNVANTRSPSSSNRTPGPSLSPTLPNPTKNPSLSPTKNVSLCSIVLCLVS